MVLILIRGLFFTLFLFFTVPFLMAVIFPAWRAAIVDPVELMK
jgi:ABC-type lipoprotein release transport system permease subunit